MQSNFFRVKIVKVRFLAFLANQMREFLLNKPITIVYTGDALHSFAVRALHHTRIVT